MERAAPHGAVAMAEAGPHTYLDDLRQDLVRAVAVCAAVLAHLWLCWMLYWLKVTPPYAGSAPLLSWIGGGVLLLGAAASYYLSRRHPPLATRLLVATLMVTAACCVLASSSPGLVYLFLLPIVLAGAALDRTAFAACAVAVGLFALLRDPSDARVSMPSADRMLPTLIIAAVGLVSWIASGTLDTASAYSRLYMLGEFSKAASGLEEYVARRMARARG